MQDSQFPLDELLDIGKVHLPFRGFLAEGIQSIDIAILIQFYQSFLAWLGCRKEEQGTVSVWSLQRVILAEIVSASDVPALDVDDDSMTAGYAARASSNCAFVTVAEEIILAKPSSCT